MKKLIMFVALFLGVFFGLGTEKVRANTFAGGIPVAVPYTNNGITYDRYVVISRGPYTICSNTLAFYFVSSEMTTAGYPASGLNYVLTRVSNTPYLRSIPSGSHVAIFSASDVSGVCSWVNLTPTVSTTGNTLYSLRSDKPEAIHDLNFTLFARELSASHPLPYTFTGTYSSWGSWDDDEIVVGAFRNAPTEGFTFSINDDGGQCVIYVRDEAGIPYPACNGDAKDCYSQASSLGFRTGSTPEVGALMVFDSGNGIPTEGHVGIVKTINSSTSITLRDSNWNLDETVQEHNVDPTSYNVIGYIYPQP